MRSAASISQPDDRIRTEKALQIVWQAWQPGRCPELTQLFRRLSGCLAARTVVNR